jgi:hypothetical protein
MNPRRTSGEIVNATLLETFLALVFLILSLAAFEFQRAESAEAARRTGLDAAAADSIRDLLAELRRERTALADSLRASTVSNDSLRGVLLSKYPPDCDATKHPVEWLTVTLVGPDQLHVVVNRTQFGLAAGTTLDLTLDAFVRRFAPVREDGERHRCRHVVRIRDTKGTDKRAFKEAVRAVTIDFRPTGYLR